MNRLSSLSGGHPMSNAYQIVPAVSPLLMWTATRELVSTTSLAL